MTDPINLSNRRITRLKVEMRNPSRVRIFLDGKDAFSLHLDVAKGLTVGQEVSSDLEERLLAADSPYRALGQAIRYLGIRARSKGETARYLASKGHDSAVVASVTEKLVHEGYLNDSEFSKEWVAARVRRKAKSLVALSWELRQKGVNQDHIREATADVDEEEAAWAAIIRRLDRWRHLEKKEFKHKVISFLRVRGFSPEVCSAILARTLETYPIAGEASDCL